MLFSAFSVISVVTTGFQRQPSSCCQLPAPRLDRRQCSRPPAATGARTSGTRAAPTTRRLDQIHRANVAKLQVAWTYETGDKGEFQTNNLIVDGVLYTASPARNVIALNAATGKELWRFDPRTERQDTVGNRQRGLVYWEGAATIDGSSRPPEPGSTRWTRGPACRSARFGENGSIHLGQGMGIDETPPNTRLNTPGVIYKDLLIMGGLVSEATAGGLRAFDVRTGELQWVFHTIPRPGEYGYDTWPPEAWKTAGGASDWSGHSVDEKRGIVYASTETAGPDFWGGDRFGANLFANSLIALDANTGQRLWHYQIVHHDLWDLDLPAPPTLLTVTHNGRRIDAVAQGTKHGLLFVFDRVTGQPLWPIHERPTPRSEIPGAADLADAAVPGETGAVDPADLLGGRRLGHLAGGASADVGALEPRRIVRGVSSAQLEGNDPVPRPRWRLRMGRGGGRSGRHSLRQRQRDPLVLSDGPDAPRRTARRVSRGRAPVHDPLRLVPRHRPDGRRRRGHAFAARHRRPPHACGRDAAPGAGRRPHAAVQPGARGTAPRDRRLPVRHAATAGRGACESPGARTGSGRTAVRICGVPPLVRSGGISRHQAALGHAERRRSEHGRDQVEGAARRIPGTDEARAFHRPARRTTAARS